ncbi:hypothetical protein [Sphingopyxis indica]|nr:hypothetical protein [Sphingopyxis indica]
MDEIRNIAKSADAPMSARMLILDLLDTGDPPSFSAAELVRAGAAFGIEAPGIRTALTRLKAEGRVRTLARGRYTIGARAEPLKARILGWRTRLDSRREWDGRWLLAFAGPQERADRTAWRRTLRALELEGFAEAEVNLWVRPNNLDGGAPGLRDRLALLDAARSLLVVEAGGLDRDREDRFRRLWDGAGLSAAHEQLGTMLERSAGRIDTMPIEAAAAETLTLRRQAIRSIMRDPLLPEALCATGSLARLIAAMTGYDRIGKTVWRDYLRG